MGVNINDNGTVKSLTAKLSGFTINGIDQIADHHIVCEYTTPTPARCYSFADIERDYDYYFVKIDSGIRSTGLVTTPPTQTSGYPGTSNIALWTRNECKITKVTVNATTGMPTGFNPDPTTSRGLALNSAIALILDEVQFPNKLILYGGSRSWDTEAGNTYDPTPGVSIWGIY